MEFKIYVNPPLDLWMECTELSLRIKSRETERIKKVAKFASIFQENVNLSRLPCISVFSSFISSSGIFTKHVSSTVEVISDSVTLTSFFIFSAILSENKNRLRIFNETHVSIIFKFWVNYWKFLEIFF